MNVPANWRLMPCTTTGKIYDVSHALIPLPPGWPPIANRLATKTCDGTDIVIAESSEQEKERFKNISLMCSKKIQNSPGHEGLVLIPCPLNHDNSYYQLYETNDKVIRIRCDCTAPQKMSSKTPFSSMTFAGIMENLDQIDLRPRRAILENKIDSYDPTIEVPKFYPRGSIAEQDVWIAPFVSNSTFKLCNRDHSGQEVCLIEQRYHQTILVCNCHDLLKHMRRVSYSKSLLQKYEQSHVFKYISPEHRGYTVEPVEGWAIKC